MGMALLKIILGLRTVLYYLKLYLSEDTIQTKSRVILITPT